MNLLLSAHSPQHHLDAPPGTYPDPYPVYYPALRHDPARGLYTHHMAGIWANPPPPEVAQYHYAPDALDSPFIGR